MKESLVKGSLVVLDNKSAVLLVNILSNIKAEVRNIGEDQTYIVNFDRLTENYAL